ncbi:MAG: GNAT family N-acetyltransferase [Flavobacteriales bacterium]|nr:GNAT family N-acetyltransferase [Flavobacteriales bacterium]
MHIHLVTPGETHALRQLVLRPGRPVAEMEWPLDHATGSFHVGMDGGATGGLVCIASFVPEQNAHLAGKAQFRLRGMATAPGHQGCGYGAAVLRFGLEQARARQADLIWCNARERAVPFYRREGFLIGGPAFEIVGIGLHHLMHLRL